MKYLTKFGFIFLILVLFSLVRAAEQHPKTFSLEECVLMTIQNNLGIAVEVRNPELADIALARAGEKFLPSLGFGFSKRNENSASYSWLDASGRMITSYSDYSAQVSQLIPSGGQISISLNSFRNDTNSLFNIINPVYKSTLNFQFTQPLLKDFGFRTSRKEILVARNNKRISEQEFKSVLLDTVYQIEEAYWNLVYSIETLAVRRQSLDLAKDLLGKNQREIDIGTLAPKEILSAQAEVAAREADILQAEAQVKDNMDRLKVLINLPAEENITEITPSDKPAFRIKEISLEEALQMARERRPDLQVSRVEIENREIEQSYARNQLLPDLNFDVLYWSPGISGERLIYLDNNPLTGIVIDRIPGGISEAMKDMFKLKYKNWKVELTLSLPLNSLFSRALYAQAKVNREQAEMRLKYQEQQVALEIATAVRAVETDYRRVLAYKVARELAEQKLEAEESKLKAGLSTNFVVLQYQRDLANTRSMELKALIDYNLSLSRLDKALGVSLDRWSIKISDVI